MHKTAFTFALRVVEATHPDLAAALAYAAHVLTNWRTVTDLTITRVEGPNA